MLVKSYLFLCLLLASSVANGEERYMHLQEGKCKPRSGPNESITLESVHDCVETCMEDEKCTSLQYKGSTCNIYYTAIKKVGKQIDISMLVFVCSNLVSN